MKISAAFPSNYLKCEDLSGQPRIVTIRACVLEWLGQGKDKEQKPVLYFEKGPKGLALNKTNATTIAKAYGDDTAGWPGRVVELYPARVEFKGDTVDAIRVRTPDPAPAAAPAAPAAAPMTAADPELDDSLADLPWA